MWKGGPQERLTAVYSAHSQLAGEAFNGIRIHAACRMNTPERWQQVERLYHAALARDANQRAAFLHEACAGDGALRNEVESLLAQEKGATLLEAPALEVAAKMFGEHRGQSFIGRQIGAYRIISLLGAGGMGEVYLARDTRLDRTVAIKILPDHLADRAELRERFDREARAIASLNHPHICTLHDIGRQDGTEYLVMEYVEGETLAQRLLKSALPLDQVLRYAIEIADALDKAHRKGITHRDLKPANIMLTKSGTKLLDFGLAKLKQEAAPNNVPLSQLPTVDVSLTAQGSIVGTLQYMAPEQVEGREVDARTDIFAFGSVVYEMATGQKAFKGKSQASVMAAILKEEPPAMFSLEPLTPPALDRVVKICLAKEPDERWQVAGDLRRELKWIAEGGSQAAPPATVKTTARNINRGLAWGAAAGLICGALLGVGAIMFAGRSQTERMVRFDLETQGKKSVGLPQPSPDGTVVVYQATDAEGRRMLWLRSLDSEGATALTGTEDALVPFWSPDGRWIGFYAQGKLKKVSRDGGSVQTIASSGFEILFGTPAWSSTGEILFSRGNRQPIYAIPDSGGAPRQVTKLDESRTENSHRWVTFLPDGRHFFFLARCDNRENNSLYEGSLESGEIRRVAHLESNVAYVAARKGRGPMLLFAQDNKLFEQSFNDNKLQGEPIPIMDVQYNAIGNQGDFALSSDGRVLVVRPAFETATRLTWFDREGVAMGTLGTPGVYFDPVISPDGSRVMFNRPDNNGGNRDIWTIDIGRGVATPVTVNPANDMNGVWAPDGRRIIFGSDRSGKNFLSMFEKSSMDPGASETRVPGLPDGVPEDWSLDGRWIAFGPRIWIAPTFGEKKAFQFHQTSFQERLPHFSPDAKWIEYQSNESGRFEVYVRPFSGAPAISEADIQISERGGYWGTWSRDGKELFFVGPDSKLYVAAVAGLGSTGTLPKPHALFDVCPGNVPTGAAVESRPFDVASNGQKFLFVCGNENENRYSVLVNWKPK